MLFDDKPRVHDFTKFAGPVAKLYEMSTAPAAMIEGPTGSAKSTHSARRCLRVATWQHASPVDGVRRARVICICPTYRRAWDTVMPSYFKVFPQDLGKFRGARGDPADHIIDMPLAVGGVASRVHLEVLFRAVNDIDIEDFFRGFEFTAIWLPEADTNKDLQAILSLGANRVGRYPEPQDRPEDAEPAFTGIFGDANAPMIGTHYHSRFHLKRIGDRAAPATDRLYRQPGGFSANAENLDNLKRIRADYYAHMASALDPYDVGRLVENKPGFGRHGKPVHPNFDQDRHVATRTIDVDPYATVYIGIDAGSNAMTPAATFSQKGYSGQWRTLAEIHLNGGQMNTSAFALEIRRVLQARFHGLRQDVGAMLCIDPAAASQNAASEYTTAGQLQAETQIEAMLAPSNVPKFRRTAMDRLFIPNLAPGEPMKIIDPACQGLIQGYAGGFHYPRRGNIEGLLPAKNKFSHVCEADEYAALCVDGLDPTEDRFIRPDMRDDSLQARAIYDD